MAADQQLMELNPPPRLTHADVSVPTLSRTSCFSDQQELTVISEAAGVQHCQTVDPNIDHQSLRRFQLN